jgi:hypothetical protein
MMCLVILRISKVISLINKVVLMPRRLQINFSWLKKNWIMTMIVVICFVNFRIQLFCYSVLELGFVGCCWSWQVVGVFEDIFLLFIFEFLWVVPTSHSNILSLILPPSILDNFYQQPYHSSFGIKVDWLVSQLHYCPMNCLIKLPQVLLEM